MNRNSTDGSKAHTEGRLLSLDFFRGFTMFLLIAEGTSLFSKLKDRSLDGTWIHIIGQQFDHHPWNGLHFWDLVQPFFMFIVGVALPFSYAKRIQRGDSNSLIMRHAIQRSVLLLLFGWMLYCIGPGHLTLDFHNVLAQLALPYLISFMMMRCSFNKQLVISFLIILFAELLYRLFPVPGFNQPFVPDRNFGSYIDILISGKVYGGHWVMFNTIPTTVHTMWGVMVGQWLMSDRSAKQKTVLLIVIGLTGVIAGYALNPFTPIIKRIYTSSYVIVSGGWCLLALAFSYWVIDVLKIQEWSKFFVIVGLNPLFIYMFTDVGGGHFCYRIARPFTMALFSWCGELNAEIVTSLVTWAMLWYICYWLYQRKIVIKI